MIDNNGKRRNLTVDSFFDQTKIILLSMLGEKDSRFKVSDSMSDSDVVNMTKAGFYFVSSLSEDLESGITDTLSFFNGIFGSEWINYILSSGVKPNKDECKEKYIACYGTSSKILKKEIDSLIKLLQNIEFEIKDGETGKEFIPSVKTSKKMIGFRKDVVVNKAIKNTSESVGKKILCDNCNIYSCSSNPKIEVIWNDIIEFLFCEMKEGRLTADEFVIYVITSKRVSGVNGISLEEVESKNLINGKRSLSKIAESVYKKADNFVSSYLKNPSNSEFFEKSSDFSYFMEDSLKKDPISFVSSYLYMRCSKIVSLSNETLNSIFDEKSVVKTVDDLKQEYYKLCDNNHLTGNLGIVTCPNVRIKKDK